MLPKGVQAQETGHESMADRVKASQKLLDKIYDENQDDFWPEGATENEINFLKNMYSRLFDTVSPNTEITAKQYFWLKDLYDKYCI